MTNPYGITEVDVPGVIGAYEAAQNNRMRRMMVQQQIQAAERSADRDQQFQTALLSALGRGGGKGSSPASGAYGMPNPVTQTPQQYGEQFADGMASPPAAAPAPAAQPSQSFSLDPATAAQLIALDPEQGARIVTAFREMGSAQAERMQRSNLYLANAAQHILSLPQDQWAGEIQRITPDLISHGITQEQIAGFQPTRQNLEYLVGQAMDVERLAQVARPNYRNVGPGEDVINLNAPPGTPPVYRSDVMMANGVPYSRPPTGGEPQTYRDGDTRVINGVTYTRQGGVWRAGAATPTGAAPGWPVPGGRASVPGNFPQ